jgi:hypothetical protein
MVSGFRIFGYSRLDSEGSLDPNLTRDVHMPLKLVPWLSKKNRDEELVD